MFNNLMCRTVLLPYMLHVAEKAGSPLWNQGAIFRVFHSVWTDFWNLLRTNLIFARLFLTGPLFRYSRINSPSFAHLFIVYLSKTVLAP